ncbi:hypothetical protein CEXT_558111 [Caerostris extrusa]|uniref:Uncharacterized protein n=1 Tax=Caerostris extrusa TaxID=172846 RepID=A0AAV4WLZ3_CAEEX|nr:hypothetical protein CEXT_558111 [Caerostris extrusa]
MGIFNFATLSAMRCRRFDVKRLDVWRICNEIKLLVRSFCKAPLSFLKIQNDSCSSQKICSKKTSVSFGILKTINVVGITFPLTPISVERILFLRGPTARAVSMVELLNTCPFFLRKW